MKENLNLSICDKVVIVMKKVIKEVKDFKPYISSRVWCFVLAFIISFISNYYPVMHGTIFIILLLLFALFFTYAYFICLGIYYVIIPSDNRVRKVDFAVFLSNNGYSIDVNKKFKRTTVNPFKKTIRYTAKLQDGTKETFLFDIRNNSFNVVKKIRKNSD